MNFLQMSSQECLPHAEHSRKINSAEPYEGCICFPVCVCVCVHMRACSVTQSRLTLCDPMDCSPLVSSVHGVFLARILGWVAVSSCGGAFLTQELSPVSCVSCTGSWILHHCTTCKAPVCPVVEVSTLRSERLGFFCLKGFELRFTRLHRLEPNHNGLLSLQAHTFSYYLSGSRQGGLSTLAVSRTDRGNRKS